MVQHLGKEALVEYSGREQEVRVSTPGRKLVEKPEAGELLLLRRVAVLGDSIHLEDYKQKATEEIEILKKKGVDKRPLAQQVASMNIWIERESKRINVINQEELDRGRQALEKQKAHFDEEKKRLEKLKAELAAAPIVTPLNSEKGMEDDDEMLMDVTEEGLRRMKDEELELRRVVATKAGSNGEKLSVKRVQEISKQADDISASLKKRQCKEDVRKEGEQEAGKDNTSRHGLLEPSWNSGWRIRHICGAREPPHDVGCNDNSGGFQKARRSEFRWARLYTAPQLTKGNLRCPAILVHQRWKGQSTYLNGGTRWLAVSLWNSVTILSAHLPHSGCKISDHQDTLSEVHSFLEKRPKGALLLGMDCNVSLAGVVDRDLIGEAAMERSGRTLSTQEKERQALLVEFMEEHSLNRTFGVDVYTSSLERWTKSTDRFHHGITRLKLPRHLDRPIRARSHGPQTCMRSAVKENDTWIKAQVHEETTKSSKLATGRQKAKEALEEDGLGNWRECVEKVRSIAQENRKDTNRRMDPLLMSMLAQYKAISSVSSQDPRFLSKRIWRRKRHLKQETIEQAIRTAADAGRAPPEPRPSLHVRWDKLLEEKESSPEELLSDYFKELYGV